MMMLLLLLLLLLLLMMMMMMTDNPNNSYMYMHNFVGGLILKLCCFCVQAPDVQLKHKVAVSARAVWSPIPPSVPSTTTVGQATPITAWEGRGRPGSVRTPSSSAARPSSAFRTGLESAGQEPSPWISVSARTTL
jgi:hypothetical protein